MPKKNSMEKYAGHKLETHVKFLGMLWIILGSIGLLHVIGGILIGGISLGAVMFLMSIPWSIGLVGGIGLLKHKKWAKVWILICGGLSLISGVYKLATFSISTYPTSALQVTLWILSTLLGIYTLWILMNSQRKWAKVLILTCGGFGLLSGVYKLVMFPIRSLPVIGALLILGILLGIYSVLILMNKPD